MKVSKHQRIWGVLATFFMVPFALAKVIIRLPSAMNGTMKRGVSW